MAQKLIALLAVAILGWIGFELVCEVLRLYGRAEADLKLGVITATGSALAFLVNNAIQSSRERRARLFENKREAYDKFFEFFFSIFAAEKSGNPLSQDKLAEKFHEFTRNVMTWGSAETVNAVNEYQQASLNSNSSNLKETFATTERLLRALRKDLGHADNRMDKFGLTKLILKADEHHKLN